MYLKCCHDLSHYHSVSLAFLHFDFLLHQLSRFEYTLNSLSPWSFWQMLQNPLLENFGPSCTCKLTRKRRWDHNLNVKLVNSNLIIFLPPKIFNKLPLVASQSLDAFCKCGQIITPVIVVAQLDEGVARGYGWVVGATYWKEGAVQL